MAFHLPSTMKKRSGLSFSNLRLLTSTSVMSCTASCLAWLFCQLHAGWLTSNKALAWPYVSIFTLALWTLRFAFALPSSTSHASATIGLLCVSGSGLSCARQVGQPWLSTDTSDIIRFKDLPDVELVVERRVGTWTSLWFVNWLLLSISILSVILSSTVWSPEQHGCVSYSVGWLNCVCVCCLCVQLLLCGVLPRQAVAVSLPIIFPIASASARFSLRKWLRAVLNFSAFELTHVMLLVPLLFMAGSRISNRWIALLRSDSLGSAEGQRCTTMSISKGHIAWSPCASIDLDLCTVSYEPRSAIRSQWSSNSEWACAMSSASLLLCLCPPFLPIAEG